MKERIAHERDLPRGVAGNLIRPGSREWLGAGVVVTRTGGHGGGSPKREVGRELGIGAQEVKGNRAGGVVGDDPVREITPHDAWAALKAGARGRDSRPAAVPRWDGCGARPHGRSAWISVWCAR